MSNVDDLTVRAVLTLAHVTPGTPDPTRYPPAAARVVVDDGGLRGLVADMVELVDADDDTAALVVALGEVAGDLRAWTAQQAALHPRGPGGRFRTTVDRLIESLTTWMQTAGNDPKKPASWKSDPFPRFDREQLRRAAKTRGHQLVRNVSRDDLVKMLVADLAGISQPGPAPQAAKPASAPRVSYSTAVPGVTLRPMAWPGGGGQAFRVDYQGTDVGSVHSMTGQRWSGLLPSGATWLLSQPLGGYASRDDAVRELVRAHQAHVAAAAPARTPTAASSAPSAGASSQAPEVQAARNVLYGVDPKSRTAARQFAVYGALRRLQFDTLSPAEQSTLLGDLSYIATTSKGPNAARARKLIDRFTPPGTPAGAVGKQATVPPAGAVAHQTRVADPAGTPGLLKVLPAGRRGRNGDGWTRTASGTGPWGRYGAAGLMLRHIDPATGDERFLMIQRGPGISDPGKWQFPGGAKDEKEDVYQGATREVVEELGFRPADLDTARVHGTHTAEAAGTQVPGLHGGMVPWSYVSIAATVPTQLKPDLSTHHARMETSDAKWMTRAEIDALDRTGKLLAPLAGGQLHTNVTSLFPTPGPARPGPPRLTGTPAAAPTPTAHKVVHGRNLVATKADQDKVRADVSAVRKSYRGKSADERLSALATSQGFDGTPTVTTKTEMDRLLATGDYIEAWRGMYRHGSKTAAQINEEMRTGPAYFGTGVFGNGYYLSTERSVARQYSDGTKNSVARVLIPKSATIRRPEQVKPLADATSSSNSRIYSGGRQGNGLGTLRDPGRYMVAAGIDGMEIPYNTQISWASARHIGRPGQPAYNWVNRAVLIIQEADP